MIIAYTGHSTVIIHPITPNRDRLIRKFIAPLALGMLLIYIESEADERYPDAGNNSVFETYGKQITLSGSETDNARNAISLIYRHYAGHRVET